MFPKLFQNPNHKYKRCQARFLEWAEAEGIYATSTLEKYHEVGNSALSFWGEISIMRINLQKVNDFKRWLKQKKLSQSRSNHFLILLRHTLKYSMEQESLKALDPNTVKLFKIPRREILYLTKGEIRLLLNSISENCITKVRLKTAIIVALSSAGRISELLDIRISKIDFKKGITTVIGKGGKVRTLILNEKSVVYIRKYLEMRGVDGCDYLFTKVGSSKLGQWDKGDADRALKTLCRRINFPKMISFHWFRKTAATMLFQNKNVSLPIIQNILGHSSVQTSLKYYCSSEIAIQKIRDVCIQAINF